MNALPSEVTDSISALQKAELVTDDGERFNVSRAPEALASLKGMRKRFCRDRTGAPGTLERAGPVGLAGPRGFRVAG